MESDEAKIERLEKENRALRAGISAMHRRAQANEGAVHREAKAKAAFERQVSYQQDLRFEAEDKWRASYMKLAQRLARVPAWVRGIFGAED